MMVDSFRGGLSFRHTSQDRLAGEHVFGFDARVTVALLGWSVSAAAVIVDELNNVLWVPDWRHGEVD